MPNCENCSVKCPQAEMAHEIAKGRMYATNELINLLKKIEIGQLVEVVRCRDCKYAFFDEENEMWKCVESAEYDEESGEWYGFYEYNNGDFFCADGERITDVSGNT